MPIWFSWAMFVFTGVLVGWTFILKRRDAGGSLSSALFFLALGLFTGQWAPLLRPHSETLSWAALALQMAFLGATFYFLNLVRRK